MIRSAVKYISCAHYDLSEAIFQLKSQKEEEMLVRKLIRKETQRNNHLLFFHFGSTVVTINKENVTFTKVTEYYLHCREITR